MHHHISFTITQWTCIIIIWFWQGKKSWVEASTLCKIIGLRVSTVKISSSEKFKLSNAFFSKLHFRVKRADSTVHLVGVELSWIMHDEWMVLNLKNRNIMTKVFCAGMSICHLKYNETTEEKKMFSYKKKKKKNSPIIHSLLCTLNDINIHYN